LSENKNNKATQTDFINLEDAESQTESEEIFYIEEADREM